MWFDVSQATRKNPQKSALLNTFDQCYLDEQIIYCMFT